MFKKFLPFVCIALFSFALFLAFFERLTNTQSDLVDSIGGVSSLERSMPVELVVGNESGESSRIEDADEGISGDLAGRSIRFRAEPTYSIQRGPNQTYIFTDAVRVEREYTAGRVFESPIFAVQSGEADGPLTWNEFTQSAVEASLDLSAVEDFLSSDAEFLVMPDGRGGELYVRIEYIYDRGEHTVSLIGTLRDVEMSSAIFVFHDRAVSGIIELFASNERVDFGLSGDGDIAVRYYDPQQDHESDCSTCQNGLEPGHSADSATLFAGDSIVTDDDILYDAESTNAYVDPGYAVATFQTDGIMTYTESVRVLYGSTAGAEAKMLAAFDATNVCLINSRLDFLFANLLATGEEPVASGGGTTATMLDAETAYANELEALLGADFCSIIYEGGSGQANFVSGYSTGSNLPTFNIYFTGGSNDITSSAGVVVHEFGHLIGGFHAWADNGWSVQRSHHGWRFSTTQGNYYRTVMAKRNKTGVGNGYNARVPYFSSPTQLIEGVPIGAVNGYDATNDPYVDPTLVYGGGDDTYTQADGYNGTNPNLGADNQAWLTDYRNMMPSINTRVSHSLADPVGGETVGTGYTIPVSWIGGDHMDAVTIALYKSGVFQAELMAVQAHLRWQNVAIPEGQTPGSDYTLRITFSSGEFFDSNPFTIEQTIPVAEDLTVKPFGVEAVEIPFPELPDDSVRYTYNLITLPTGGTLTGVAPDLLYTADVGTKLDSFTYSISFGGVTSAVKTVSIEAAQPVAHWKLDDGAGDVLTDSSGNGHHATLNRGTWLSEGQLQGALQFDSSQSDYATIPSSVFSGISDQISFCVWVYGGDEQPAADTLFYAKTSANGRALNVHLPFSNGIVYWDAGYDGSYDRINLSAASEEYQGQWNHWIFTKNASTGEMSIYLNGALWHSGTGKTKAITDITNAYLGSQGLSSHYDGILDDILIYDIALSEANAATLYESYVHAPGLKAYWSMDDGSGSIVKDMSGNRHDGTLSSGTWVANGKVSGALQFEEDTDDYLTLPSSAFAGVSDQISFSFWALGSDPIGTRKAIIRAINSSNNIILNVYLPWNDNHVMWFAGYDEGNDLMASKQSSHPEYFQGQWNHWVFTKNTNTGYLRIYLNGAELANESGNTKPMDGISTIYVGAANGNGAFNYDGLVDEIKLYNYELTAAEVQDLYLSSTAYGVWLGQFTGLLDRSIDGDPEGDGIETVLEFVLNGTPDTADMSILPQMDAESDHFVFSFTRRVDSEETTDQVFEYCTDLALDDWTELRISAPAAAEVTLGAEVDGLQSVTVTVSKSVSSTGQLFGRLKVE